MTPWRAATVTVRAILLGAHPRGMLSARFGAGRAASPGAGRNGSVSTLGDRGAGTNVGDRARSGGAGASRVKVRVLVLERSERPMSTQLNLDGDAREAMDFSAQVFGGTVTFNTCGEFDDPDAPGPTGSCTRRWRRPRGADTPPEESMDRGNDVSMSVSGDDEAELRGYWDALSDGGQLTLELEPQMWGDVFGMCVDRFGVSWIVNIAGDQA